MPVVPAPVRGSTEFTEFRPARFSNSSLPASFRLTLCNSSNLPSTAPAENLALDEALLLTAEEEKRQQEVLRLWEPRQPFVVLGSSSRIAAEVRLDGCRDRGIPVLRRTSGGAAIVAGPGCLMYALVLSI